MNKIKIASWLGTNIYCTLLLLYVYFSARRSKITISKELKSYGYLVFVVVFSFIADSLSRLYTYESLRFTYHVPIVVGTYIKYITTAIVVPVFYKLYIIQLKGNVTKGIKRIYAFLWIMQIFHTLLTLSTYFTKNIFYYDASGVYHRGRYYIVPVAMMLIASIIAETFIILNKNKLSKQSFSAFSLFLGVPIVGMFLQAMFYGLALAQMGLSFAVIVIYITVISTDLNKDHLTTLNDRKFFDRSLDEFIIDANSFPFSALMIDMDDFKEINDKYGHFEGDKALKNAAQIIMDSVRNNDIVCRYGGDEFVVLLRNCDKDNLDYLMNRLKDNLDLYNSINNHKYDINFSMGGAVYSSEQYDSSVDFLREIDRLMYENKKINKMNRIA